MKRKLLPVAVLALLAVVLLCPGCKKTPSTDAQVNADTSDVENTETGTEEETISEDEGLNLPEILLEKEEILVVFQDYEGNELKSELVASGSQVEPPEGPERDGYIFLGWEGNYLSPTEETVLKPIYEGISGPTVAAEHVWAEAGTEKVEVQVRIKENPGLLGMMLSVSFDESVLELTDIENGPAFENVLTFTPAKELCSGSHFLWDGESISQEETSDGVILTLRFKVSEDAVPGIYPITLVCPVNGAVDNDVNAVDISLISGNIIVNE